MDKTSLTIDNAALQLLLADGDREGRLTGAKTTPTRNEAHAPWPAWANPALVTAYQTLGLLSPWQHQIAGAEAIHIGQHTALATATGTGKSLSFWLPALTRAMAAAPAHGTLYLSPTKALAADQLAALNRLLSSLPTSVRRPVVATCDGDTPRADRQFLQEHAEVILTNPDFIHYSMLPGHRRWARYLKSISTVVIDEGHMYRGVFGAHVAQVLRRLGRVIQRYSGECPTFVVSSATSADPRGAAARLVGVDPGQITEVSEDTAPHGRRTLALWNPPEIPAPALTVAMAAPAISTPNHDDGDAWLADPWGQADPFDVFSPDAPPGSTDGTSVDQPRPATRRTATSEASELLGDLVTAHYRTLAFTRSRRGAETVATLAQHRLHRPHPELDGRVAAYRGGYLPEERRKLEQAIRAGDLLGLATTNALELGVDISGLDAVLLAGWPGTMMSLWQQAGRAGRAGRDGLVVFIARDDPLDQYLVTHPDSVFDRPLEAVVFDPTNKFVIAGHLCAAAAEQPIRPDELATFGDPAQVAAILADLVAAGALRRREAGWYWTHAASPAALVDIRGAGGAPIRVVDAKTGALLGTVDAGTADSQVHTGAVYVHQGAMFVVDQLDLADRVAFVTRRKVDYGTWSHETMSLTITETERQQSWGPVTWGLGSVEITTQVISFERRRLPDMQTLGTDALDLPERTLETVAAWWQVPLADITAAGISADDLPGALHAVEHAAIGLLPLFATCDRLDLGGLSTELHADTGMATVFVYDAYPGGAGFAARGFEVARDWLTATRDLINGCQCAEGCPACIQSPKCGTYNSPLSKAAAVKLLDVVLSHAPAD